MRAKLIVKVLASACSKLLHKSSKEISYYCYHCKVKQNHEEPVCFLCDWFLSC